MAVRGIFMSNQSMVGDRNTALSGRVLKLGYGGTAPLLALSAGMPEKKVYDTAWSWSEDQHISGNTTTTAAYNAGETTIAVADSNIWVPNAVLLVESTGEHLFVTAIAGLSVTVVRAIGGTTVQNIASGARIQLIGTAFEEAGGKPTPVTQLGETYTNLVQIFKNGWAVSGTTKAIQFETGGKLADNKQKCFQYHAEDIERSFWFGKRGISIINNKEYRFTNGVINQLNQYGALVESAAYGGNAGEMSIQGIQSFTRRVFDRNYKGFPNERVVFGSSQIMELIQIMTRKDSDYQISVKETEYGFNVSTLNFLGNKLTMMTHPLFIENQTWAKMMVVLHPGLIEKRILRDTWTEEFGAARSNNAGVDADEGFIADELGFHVAGARAMGIMTNITTGVAS